MSQTCGRRGGVPKTTFVASILRSHTMIAGKGEADPTALFCEPMTGPPIDHDVVVGGTKEDFGG